MYIIESEKGNRFITALFFPALKTEKSEAFTGYLLFESNPGKSRTGSFEDGIFYSAKEPGR
jgi:hypothetical protein